ncbi:MAG: envelope stress response membrane protein PspB [Alphaproteobacteria bacterium]
MGWIFAVPLIVFLTLVAPLWIIFHYITKWRTSKSLSQEDEALLAELWASAEKMEDRINTLERILDAEAPDWRNRT